MKKILTRFANSLLSKEQMKVVKGGDTYGGIYNGVNDAPYLQFACICNNSGYIFRGGAQYQSDVRFYSNYYCGNSGSQCTVWS